MNISKYLKTYISFSVGTWFRFLFSLISIPLISRLISASEFGKSSLFLVFISTVATLTTLGLDSGYLRFYKIYAESEKDSLFWMCLTPAFLISLLVSVLLGKFSSVFSTMLFSAVYKDFGYLSAASLLSLVLHRFSSFSLRAKKKGFHYSLTLSTNVFSSFLATILYATLVERSFRALIIGNIVGNVISTLVSFWFTRAQWNAFAFRITTLRDLIRYSLPLVPARLLNSLFMAVDRFTIRYLSTFTELGLYSAALKLSTSLDVLKEGFTLMWAPLAYEKYESGDRTDSFFSKTFDLVSALSFSAAFFVLVIKEAIFLLFASDYRKASPVIPFLLLFSIFDVLETVNSIGLHLKKKTHMYLLTLPLAIFTNIFLATFSVKFYGARGAALSKAGAYVIYFLLQRIISRRLYPVNFDRKKLIVVSTTYAMIAAFLSFSESAVVNILLGFAGLVITSLVYKKDMQVLISKIFRQLTENSLN